MSSGNSKIKIPISDLSFYFDAQEKDRIDLGKMGRKTGQVLALREKLLAMPEGEFDIAIKTIEKLVEASSSRPTLNNKDLSRKERQQYGKELYERSANPPVKPGEEIRKI